jgi:hypothetical protein
MIVSTWTFTHVPRHVHRNRQGPPSNRDRRARCGRLVIVIEKLLPRPAITICQPDFIPRHTNSFSNQHLCRNQKWRSRRSSTSRQGRYGFANFSMIANRYLCWAWLKCLRPDRHLRKPNPKCCETELRYNNCPFAREHRQNPVHYRSARN